ncbi:alpha-ketoglutarate-dependent dioxygenase alkB homolog 3 isoform X2 [Eretmochelys imbricata]
MEDKRQRARVQGGWAGPIKSRAASHAAPGASAARNLVSVGTDQTWMRREQLPPKKQFVFKEPAEVERKAPEPRVIDEQGLHEISTLPTGVSRVRLIPGFIDTKQADWMFEQLLQEIPWRQRTHLRQDLSYKEPRLTSWYGELPYTYSRLTMQPNPNEENGDYTYVERVRIPLPHGTLLTMEGATQEDWQHRVPKEYHAREPRINLTFRTIYSDPEGMQR